MSHTYLSNVC